jgi:DNA-binding response OmpR family regulator
MHDERRPETVLVVDDDPHVCRLLTDWLGKARYLASFVTTAEGSRSAAVARDVDLLLIDLVLPDGNGLDLGCAHARVRPEVPFILVSGHLTTETTVEAMKRGAAYVIAKPFDQPTLIREVRNALAHHRPLGEAWDSLDGAGSNARKWARVIARVCATKGDPTTTEELAHVLGLSAGAFRELCGLLKIVARLLRAVIRSDGGIARIPSLLTVGDRRTLDGLMSRSGLADVAPDTRISARTFILGQHFVPIEHDAVQALLALFPDNA